MARSVIAMMGRAALLGLLIGALPAHADPASLSDPYGMVSLPDNTRHFDPGIASPGAPFYPSRASTGGRILSISDFDPPTICAACHADIYAQWKGSMHSNAWFDPVYRAALNLISKATNHKVDLFCMGCHTPIGVVTKQARLDGAGMSPAATSGVQCDFCHNVSATSGIGNGSYILTPKLHGRELKFGPYRDAISPYHDTAYSRLHTRSELCGDCHNVTHPFNHLPIERTYTEWRDSSYAGEGIQCEDCHMTPVRGKASQLGKFRERVYQHYFVGGNALVTRLLGADRHASLAEAQLLLAAKVEIANTPLTAGRTNIVRVRVTNVGAGHKLPTGFPEGREMWLDLRVVDARGVQIYRLGAIRHGETEPGTRSFKVVLGDKYGRVVKANVMDADRILYDTRIEPHGYRDVEYPVDIPEGTPGPVDVIATLKYWSFSQALLDQLMGPKAPAAHITVMAQRSLWLSLKPAPLAATHGRRPAAELMAAGAR